MYSQTDDTSVLGVLANGTLLTSCAGEGLSGLGVAHRAVVVCRCLGAAGVFDWGLNASPSHRATWLVMLGWRRGSIHGVSGGLLHKG